MTAVALIGRDGEKDMIAGILERVHHGGQALVIHGEAGIGKSALLASVAGMAADRSMLVMSTAGVQSEMHLPYAALHQLLRPVLARAENLPAVQRDAARAAFGMSEAAVPDLFLVALAALELLSDVAVGSPVLVIADDEQWLDASSADVLTFVARRVQWDPIAVLASVRDGYDSPLTAAGLPGLQLTGLADRPARDLLDAHSPGLAPAVRDRLLEEAEGNPLALLELPAALSSGVRGWEAVLPTHLPLTARLEQAFAARAADLPAATRAVLLVAAADDSGALGEVVEAGGIVAGVRPLVEDLNPAVGAGLIRIEGPTVRFRHPLIRSAVYRAATVAECHAAHAALAHVLAGDPDRRVWHRAEAAIGRDAAVAAELEEAAGRARRCAQHTPSENVTGRGDHWPVALCTWRMWTPLSPADNHKWGDDMSEGRHACGRSCTISAFAACTPTPSRPAPILPAIPLTASTQERHDMTAMINDSSPGARGQEPPWVHSAGDGKMRGRDAQRQVVRGLLRRAQRGLGGVVLVDGEPGLGKSLLLREASDEAAGLGFSLAAGAADPLGRAIPFFALRAALRDPFARLTADGNDRDLPDAPAWWISQVQRLLEQRASAAPVLVCLDDLQWAGPATLAALRSLLRELKRYPVAWILARSSAPQQDTEYLFGLLENDGAARITLAGLGDETVAALLADAFGAPPDQPLLALARGAAGNPLLLTELIRGLRDDNAVQVTGGRAVLVAARLPQRMHRVAQRRLDGLSRQARHLLVTAAVLGPSFRLEDAAEMLGETPAALLPTVEEAMGAGVMTAAENVFSFRHQLLRRAVSELIPRPARNALHRQYGQILLSRGGSAAVAAGHLLQAAHPGDPASLADLDKAAAQALGRAPQAAADLALRALELTPPGGPGALSRAVAAAEALTAAGRLDQAARIARDMLAQPLPPVCEARLRCALSSVLCARGQASDAHAEARMVLAQPQLPDDLRDQAVTARLQALAGLRDELAGPIFDAVPAALGQHDGHAVAAALVTRAVRAWDKGQIGDGLELLRDAARRGGRISPDARHVQPLLALATALIDLRQLDEAENILQAADTQTLHGIPAQAALSILRARIHLANGRLATAAADAQTALATAETLGAHGYASTAHCVLAVIALRRGDVAAATHHIASQPAPMPHSPGLYARAETTMTEAQISEARNGPAAAIGRIREVCADLPAHRGLLLGDPALAAWLARTALAAGDHDLAASTARTAEAIAFDNPGYPAINAAAAHSTGLADQDQVRLTEAAAQHPDPWARASAAEDLGALHARQADKDQAIHHLTEAIHGYQLTGAAADTARIRRRLRELGVRRRYWAQSPGRPLTGWHSLTETERAASELVAQGLGNKQVADQMYISVHTVAFHMRQIFRKLNIGSRVELARVVLQQAHQTPPPSG